MQMFYEVIPIRLFRDNGSVLTYSSELPLKPGHIVEIPLGKSKTYGIILKPIKNVDFKTKPISKLLYSTPLPSHILKSIIWLSNYYLIPLPQVAKLFLPQGIGKTRRNNTKSTPINSKESSSSLKDSSKIIKKLAKNTSIDSINSTDTPLNTAQKTALKSLKNIKTNTKLLFGITGSGKTNIYLKLANEAFESGKSTILLVPEIALTSQLVQIFNVKFKDQVILIHSRKTEAERHKIWEKILESTDPKIIIGPRSALFSPVNNLGLIIIDEAHEDTYFQENAPRYSALRLASFMASTCSISCIYGTATPLISDYYLAKSKNSLVTLSTKAKSSAVSPNIKVVDFKNLENFKKNRYFSDALLTAINRNLKNGHQTLIFHNRRGSSPLTICENCGWQAVCPNCFLPLTLHADNFNLICHTCSYSTKVPTSCPECNHPSIIHKGFGTKLLEEELKKLFKDAKIIRFDADSQKTESLDQNYDRVKTGKYDIIIGTKTIAKGLDLPLLATVGVVQADAGLSLPDYSAEEKTFHLLTQVIGRVGRGHLDTAEVFVQTYQPDSEVIKAGITSDYQRFYHYATKRRKKGSFPPYYYLAKLTVTYKTEKTTVKYIKSYYQTFSKNPQLKVTKPSPAFHEHGKRGYTWQIIIRAKSRLNILKSLSDLPHNPNLRFTIDPPSLL